MDGFWIGLAALVPSIGVGILFYFVMRFVIRADRNERAQLVELDQLSEQSEDNSNSKQ
jgi:F0F1-type ATP synthase membrane subunit c/vacuolar-type H+-ATPase subunit K